VVAVVPLPAVVSGARLLPEHPSIRSLVAVDMGAVTYEWVSMVTRCMECPNTS
jgi:ABC-type uncharacterized transport system permease subunit